MNLKKIASLVALASAIVAVPAMAQDIGNPAPTNTPTAEAPTAPKQDAGFFAPDVHVLVSDEDTVLTAELAWQHDRWSGFSFVDVSTSTDFWITDNEVRFRAAGPVYVSAEGGYNRFGGAMGKVGVGVDITGLPVIRDNFAYLRVYAQKSVFGPDADHLVGVSWGTRDISLGDGTSLYFSGFADIKANAPDVIQPQVWLKSDRLPFQVGSEVSIFGNQATVSAAIKLNF